MNIETRVKESGYKKQKKKIKELEHDLKMIVLHFETEEGQEIYLKWLGKLDNSKDNE